MTVGKAADIANVRESLVAEAVQRELQATALPLQLFTDYSSLAAPGAFEIKVPRASSFTAADLDLSTPTAASPQNLLFAEDTIALDRIKIVNYLIPGYIQLEAKPSYEMSAARRAASAHGRAISVDVIDELWGGADAANDVDFDAAAATSEIQEKILEMIEVADNAEMLDDGRRTLMIRPAQRRQMLQVPDFVRADQRGTVDSPLVNGQLGTIYNVRVVVTTFAGAASGTSDGSGEFADGKMMLVHPESLGYAFHSRPTVESEVDVDYGPGSRKYSWGQKYGLSELQEGDLIVRAWNTP